MELRAIDRTDRGVGRLHKALSIYRDTILPEAQNPERQILYWIDHSKEKLSDEFRCFALLDKGDVVGYLQYSYFTEEHLFFFEYLCLQNSRRHGLTPSSALPSIEEHLLQNYDPGFTIVFEIARKQAVQGNWTPDKKLIAYFKHWGFRTVDFDYHYPILQTYEGATSYPADLMVLLPERRKAISATEVRTILRCIYFKHYLRWDRPFLSDHQFAQRERLINQLYSKEVAKIGGQKSFDTKGDDRRTLISRLMFRRPKITSLMRKIFAPKFPRILVIMIVLMAAQWALGGVILLIPFVLAVCALYCLAEDSDTSRRLFVTIMSRINAVGRRAS
jgi:hypothetical protein